MRPSRIVHRSTPSISIARPVAAKPGGSIGPVFVPRIRQRHATLSPATLKCGSSLSSKCRSGNATHASRMNACTAAGPRAASGRAGSSHTTSSVTRSAIAVASWPFQAARYRAQNWARSRSDGAAVDMTRRYARRRARRKRSPRARRDTSQHAAPAGHGGRGRRRAARAPRQGPAPPRARGDRRRDGRPAPRRHRGLAGRRARRRQRPAGRRRARRLPGAARPRREHAGAVPHRPRHPRRPPVGLRLRRRRLRHQAVRLRRGRCAAAGAPASRRGRGAGRRRRPPSRPGRVRGRRRGRARRAHADRVPPARRARRPPGRGRPPRDAHRRRVAGRRDRPRQHARRLHRAAAAQARAARRCAAHRHRARGRVLAAMIGRLRRRPAGLRNRLLAVVLLATVLALIATTAGFNVLLASRLNATADDLLRTQVNTERAEVMIVRGRLTVPDFPRAGAVIDEPVWIFAGKRAIERPRTLLALDRQAFALAGGPQRTREVPSRSARMLAVPVRDRGRQVGTIVAAVSMTPYRRARDTALVSSLGVAVTLLLLVLVATRWVLAAGLRPVARMTAQAAEWSENDLDRRFDLGPPHDELTQLAATLDALLGRLAAGLRHEQRFSAELSHELRTPLSRMRAQAQLALADDLTDEQREAWAAVLRSSSEMADTLDALLAGARAEARPHAGIADAGHAAEAVAERFRPLAAERGVSVAVRNGNGGLRAGVDLELLERLLQPLVDNACRYAESEVTIAVRRESGRIVYEITDDGPGVREDERERIFEPAVRGSAGTALRDGTGLGLALARRLARAAGGSVEAVERPAGGGCFAVRVPPA